jgi:hypothetical protein
MSVTADYFVEKMMFYVLDQVEAFMADIGDLLIFNKNNCSIVLNLSRESSFFVGAGQNHRNVPVWGVLLAYNLVRYQMIKMAGHLKGYWPNQLSFSESCGMVMRMLVTLQGASPGCIPDLMRDLESMGQLVKLATRRERAFPKVVKERP